MGWMQILKASLDMDDTCCKVARGEFMEVFQKYKKRLEIIQDISPVALYRVKKIENKIIPAIKNFDCERLKELMSAATRIKNEGKDNLPRHQKETIKEILEKWDKCERKRNRERWWRDRWKQQHFPILKASLDIITSELRQDVKSMGGKIYQIGGAVRDEFLGKVSKDLDLIITGIDIEDLQELLNKHGKVNLVGKSFGVLKFNPTGEKGEPVDIVVPRIEVSTGEGHKDFEVKLGKDITLEEEQLRRDFWMNAIAKDIETGEIVDIEGKGQLDIKNKQISVINPKAFEDDPLRMLRAVQFAARFEFNIEEETMKEIKKNAQKITTVSNERFQEEFRKMFEKAGRPTIGVELLVETGLMKHILSNGKVNPLMDKLDKNAFPAFLALFGEDSSSEELQNLMKLSNKDAKIVRAVMDFQKLDVNDLNIVKFLSKMTDKSDIIRNIDALQEAKNQKTLSEQLKSMKSEGKPTNLKELAVTGQDLVDKGLSGRKIGEILDFLLELAVKTGKNDEDFLLEQAKSKFSGELWKSILKKQYNIK